MMDRVRSRSVYEGRLSTVRIDEFRHPDGSTTKREVVGHPGAVAIIAHDDRSLYLVRQPREAVADDRLLELPAGKLDVEGERPLETAKRELAEEVGVRAASWTELKRFYTSPGFTDEEVWVFLATDLAEVDAQPDPEERIEVVRHPVDKLDAAIEECEDAKSLIGLMLLREIRRRERE